jgi:uridine kinase
MKKRMIIGVAGGSGSGKTTLADRLAAHFGERVSMLRHDDYYKSHKDVPVEERASFNYDHPSAFDTALLVEHLDRLADGDAVDSPIYDYTIHDRSDRVRRVESREVIILEGILILENPEILSRLDIKIFVDTDADVRIIRRLTRDVNERGRSLDSVITQYLSTVKPMHEAFVEPSKKNADLIVPIGGKNDVAIDMIIERISAHLSK